MNWTKTKIYFKPYIFNSRDRLFNKNVITDSNYSNVASERWLISYFDARKFWYIFVLAIFKLTRFLTTCKSATSFKIWTFRAFLYISETTGTIFLKIASHNLHSVYNNVWNVHVDWFTATPWNFKTTNPSKIRATTFTVLTLR